MISNTSTSRLDLRFGFAVVLLGVALSSLLRAAFIISWQGRQDLLLGEVDVLQSVVKQGARGLLDYRSSSFMMNRP